jgi:RNA polymerase sigma factor (sigma-70 family)
MKEHKDSSKIKQMLRSEQARNRREAIKLIFDGPNRLIYKIFLQTGNVADADDLYQEFFLKMDRRFFEDKLSLQHEPISYILRAANNHFIDWYREQKKRKTISVVKFSDLPLAVHDCGNNPEAKFEKEATRRSTRQLLFHIENETDRFIAVLHYLFDLTQKKISLLTGYRTKFINNSFRRFKRQLLYIGKNKEHFLEKQHDWEELLSFTGEDLPISVALVNVSPENIAPESEIRLLRDLGISSQDEMLEQYIAMIRAESINSSNQMLHYTFMPRIFFSKDVFYYGMVIQYISYLIHFERVYLKSSWKDVLHFSNKLEFPGRVIGNYDDENKEWYEYIFAFPTLNMKSRKAFNYHLILYQKNPSSRKPTIYVYQNSVLDPRKPYFDLESIN